LPKMRPDRAQFGDESHDGFAGETARSWS
jgi:hypothetical protein